MSTSRRRFFKQLGLGAGGLMLLSPALRKAWTAEIASLPRSSPEEEGMSSVGILAFLDAISKSDHELHSLMIVRHGHVVAEGWWAPYSPELRHTMYSMSKSFTSTAVGFAVSEGKLTVDDKVVSFFPKDLPDPVSDRLAALRVKDLLTMSVGNEKEPTHEMVEQENWVKAFLAAPIVHDPGTAFLYNSAATYMCSAIVQQVTGQKVIDYLTPRLFEPLSIEGATWETCPRGINTGGWGLSVQTEALAKFGQLYLQKGQWNGREIIPAKWIEEATTFKVQQPDPAKPTRPKELNDWLQGYCYQFWRCTHHAFRGDGAFGQFTIVLPEQDAVIAITGESHNLQGELDLVWEHLLPAMKDRLLPDDRDARGRLKDTLTGLALPLPKGQTTSRWIERVTGKSFRLDPNPLKWQSITLNFEKEYCLFTMTDESGAYPISCGFNHWERGRTLIPGGPPRIISGGAPPVGTQHKVAAAGAWRDERTFEMIWRYNETPHHDTVTCHFDEDGNMHVTVVRSTAPGSKQSLLGWPAA